MRLFITFVNDVMIFRDKSLDGFPRWVVEDRDGRVTIYNKQWYSLEEVKKLYEYPK